MGRAIYPPPGAIKSVTRSIITFSGVGTTATATIAAVNTGKSLLTKLGEVANADDVRQLMSLELTNSTTVTATRSASTTGSQTVTFQVVEYY